MRLWLIVCQCIFRGKVFTNKHIKKCTATPNTKLSNYFAVWIFCALTRLSVYISKLHWEKGVSFEFDGNFKPSGKC
jgi:hypothetical protein